MTDRFVAVDVGTGDAFFLQRGTCLALVDGGQASGFLRRMHRATSVDAVSVLVCTHNDRDHANGVLEFLEDGGAADECWLPATWMEAASRLCAAPHEDLESLLFGKDEKLPEVIPREENDEVSAITLTEQLETIVDHPDGTILTGVDPRVFLVFPSGILIPRRLTRSRGRLTATLEDAFRIVHIALAATRLQIPIKWFAPEATPTSRYASFLNVVNAREVTSIRRAKLSLRGVVGLTTVNRFSLVLYSPRTDEAPGVLFCADSGFKTLPIPPADRGMIVTAPHHGAGDKENVAVYGKLNTICAQADPDSWQWVRSDRDCCARPCAEYLLRRARYCTRCRGRTGHQPFQDVTFQAGKGSWMTAARSCNCV